jgi:hypothetical protein
VSFLHQFGQQRSPVGLPLLSGLVSRWSPVGFRLGGLDSITPRASSREWALSKPAIVKGCATPTPAKRTVNALVEARNLVSSLPVLVFSPIFSCMDRLRLTRGLPRLQRNAKGLAEQLAE